MVSSDIDPMDDIGFIRKPARGQKSCPKCHKRYNNNALPLRCTEANCDGYLGGQEPIIVKEKDPIAQLITSTIASVRQHPGGHPVRVFVDLKENKVMMQSNN